jgi:hypothetical protein
MRHRGGGGIGRLDALKTRCPKGRVGSSPTRRTPEVRHDEEVVCQALALVASGLNDCEVSRRTGIPRTTIRDWRLGRSRLPATARGRRPIQPEPKSYSYLLGLYLGDGCVSAGPRQVFRLRITLDAAYPGIVDECVAAVQAVAPQNRVGLVRCKRSRKVEVYAYSKQWAQLFPQHAEGPKHLRPIALAHWQRRLVDKHSRDLLRGLIHSDGSRSLNTVRHRGANGQIRTYSYPRYTFENRSEDIRAIFCGCCDRVGVHWTQSNARTISVARAGCVAKLDEFIGPKH